MNIHGRGKVRVPGYSEKKIMGQIEPIPCNVCSSPAAVNDQNHLTRAGFCNAHGTEVPNEFWTHEQQVFIRCFLCKRQSIAVLRVGDRVYYLSCTQCSRRPMIISD